MIIKTAESFINQYDDISDYCKTTGEPVLLTRNGEADLVVMSIDSYERNKRMVQLVKELYEIEIDRLNDRNFISFDEAKKRLKGQ